MNRVYKSFVSVIVSFFLMWDIYIPFSYYKQAEGDMTVMKEDTVKRIGEKAIRPSKNLKKIVEGFKFKTIRLKRSCSDGTTKSYMDLSKITCRDSKQYKMKKKYSLDGRGHWYYKEKGKKFYVVALGNYFGDVGDKFKITLSTGIEFYAIKGDSKADRDTIERYCHKTDKSVIEFIIDTKKAIKHYGGSNGYVLNGNFNNSDSWRGSISRIQKVC